MAQEALHKNGFWLYGVIVGLAIKEALASIIPHAFTLYPEPVFPEAARFVVTLILIIRFFFGSTVFWDEVYFAASAEEEYRTKNYALDFLFGLIHFIVFFSLATSIEIHGRSVYLFQVLLSVILAYDLLWWWACRKSDTRSLIRIRAVVNAETLLLAALIYLIAKVVGASPLLAEEVAFVPILLFSFVDIAELVTGKRIIGPWLAGLGTQTPGRSAAPPADSSQSPNSS